MHPVSALERLGGVGSYKSLMALCDRLDLLRLVDSGDIVKDARGRYARPVAHDALRAANALGAVASHLSAAAHWGWELKTSPPKPHVTLARTRKVSAGQRKVAIPHWGSLGPDDVIDGLVTSKARTLTDCLSNLPFDEALAVADSALRHEDVSPAGLIQLAEGVVGSGCVQARRVAQAARGEAANPFESVLRAISLDVPGLHFEPQVKIADDEFFARPDLVDVDHRLVAEADSHEWHSTKEALTSDCRRYTGLTVRGWRVVRFVWEDVMSRPEDVAADLSKLVLSAEEPATLRQRRPKSA